MGRDLHALLPGPGLLATTYYGLIPGWEPWLAKQANKMGNTGCDDAITSHCRVCNGTTS